MEFMALFMVFLGFFGFIVCLVWLIIRAIKGGKKKPVLLGLLVCVVLFFAGGVLGAGLDTEKNNETVSAIESPVPTSETDSKESTTKYPKRANTTIVERKSEMSEDTEESEGSTLEGPNKANTTIVEKASESTPEPTPEPTAAPTPAATPAPTPVPTPPPAPTPTATPVLVQSVSKTISNGDGTYTHDFSGGRVLITTESNNNDDPVYHTKDCRAAKKIAPESEGWYESEQAAKSDGRRICGYCGR